MSFRLILLPGARNEMRDAARWWATHRNAEQAAAWIQGFMAKLETLQEDPLSYPPADEGDLFQHDIRQLNYGLSSKPTHRALFTVVSPDRVVVLAIRHLAQGPLDSDQLQPP